MKKEKKLHFKKHNGITINPDNDSQSVKKILDHEGLVYVAGDDFGFKDVIIKTRLETMKHTMEHLKLTSNKTELIAISTSITKTYENKTSDELISNDEVWQNFSNDLVLFYCCRFLIDSNFPIPVRVINN